MHRIGKFALGRSSAMWTVHRLDNLTAKLSTSTSGNRHHYQGVQLYREKTSTFRQGACAGQNVIPCQKMAILDIFTGVCWYLVLRNEMLLFKVSVFIQSVSVNNVAGLESVWPDKNRQMSIKVTQKWFHYKNDRIWHLYKNCLRL